MSASRVWLACMECGTESPGWALALRPPAADDRTAELLERVAHLERGYVDLIDRVLARLRAVEEGRPRRGPRA